MSLHVQRPSVLVGLVGRDIQASRSPEMHMREGEAQGLRLIYNLVDLAKLDLSIESLPDLLVAAERTGFAGLNVTIPCKQAIIPFLHELSDDARALGAVNTVVLRDGKRIGHNTDWSGFAEGFKRGLPDAPMGRVVQFGAGGAGAAVAHAALMLGTDLLTVFDTDRTKADVLAKDLSSRFGPHRAVAGDDLEGAVAEADGLINCTPVGMAKYPGTPVPIALLRPELWVAEIIYFPLETELLRASRALGCRTVDGGGMAVFQAAEAFRLFTGVVPDHERMLRHFASL